MIFRNNTVLYDWEVEMLNGTEKAAEAANVFKNNEAEEPKEMFNRFP